VTDTGGSGSVPDEPGTPSNRPRPKRGAFPTPKSELEKATPYVPDLGTADDCTEREPESGGGTDDEKSVDSGP
jgi:hypothetical protein